MRLSLELLNVLVLCVALTILLKDRVDQTMSFVDNNAASITSTGRNRNLQQRGLGDGEGDLTTDFSFFLGDWYDCMHTTLTTFSGETSEKDIVDTSTCENNNLGNITSIRNDQALKFDLYLPNRCSFHALGGDGQRPCPNDGGSGKVLVKYSFKGVGSFADSDRVQFFADQSYIRNLDGDWKANFQKAAKEDVDSMVCKKHMEGIVCDWHLNELGTSAIPESSGCQKDGECRPGLGQQKCKLAGGIWTEECPRTRYINDGFMSDTFGSYYLVKDPSQCDIDCRETAEAVRNREAEDDEDER